nr:MAG TPA_asm: hypothetical protein [Caudoviricetes sp.]
MLVFLYVPRGSYECILLLVTCYLQKKLVKTFDIYNIC